MAEVQSEVAEKVLDRDVDHRVKREGWSLVFNRGGAYIAFHVCAQPKLQPGVGSNAVRSSHWMGRIHKKQCMRHPWDTAVADFEMWHVVLNLLPSPPWGRGWLATGVLISRGETGEGVKTVAHVANLTQGVQLGIDALAPT